MKRLLTIFTAIIATAGASRAQQSVLVPWNHTWAIMHPMGAMPNVPAGGDADFDTTWYLKAEDFATQYNGPVFGSVPALVGIPATPGSYDSKLAQGPIGYGAAGYFTSTTTNPEFTAFGAGGTLTIPSGTAPNTNRRAAYFRTTFTVPAGNGSLIKPRLRYLIDDGAYVYLDGELISAIFMATTTPPNLDSYAATPEVLAGGAGTATEDVLRTLDLFLPAGTANAATGARTIKQIISLAPGEHTLALSVRNNSLTSSDLAMAVELSAEEGCLISATPTPATRSDSGTPYFTGDDTFTFHSTVTGVNGGAGWTSDDPAVPVGSYDTPTVFGPFPVSASPKVITFTSASAPPCTTQVSVTPPGGTLQAAAQTFARQQQGTVDPADDTFTASVLVTGQFVSNAWKIVSTTPATAAAGSPAGGTSGAATSFGPYPIASSPVTVTLADAADPSITTQVVLTAQAFIGSRSFGGITAPFLSAAPLPAQWVATTGLAPVITINNSSADIWREFRSPVFDLSAVGAVGFAAELVARETSTGSNFESVDNFRARLVVTDAAGASEISLIAPFDADGNGLLNGSPTPYDPLRDEFNLKREPVSTTISNVMRMEAFIPAGALSVQLIVEAKGIDGSDFFDVRKVSFSDQCGFAATATNVTRVLNGQPGNPAAHTVNFTLRATPAGAVSPTGWNVSFNRLGTPVSGASVSSGAYSTNVSVTGLPAEGGPITAILTDKEDPSCFTGVNITVAAPPQMVGTFAVGASSTSVFSSGPPTGWSPVAGGLDMSAAAAISDFSTEPVNLSGTSGPVAFTLDIEAEETSTTSNFEDTDIFEAELILNDGNANSTVRLVAAPHDKDGNGILTGAPVPVAPAVYDPAKDEFNPAGAALTVPLKNTFRLTYSIPDNIVSATLHLRARVDSAGEFLRLRNVSWTGSSSVGTGDADGDGASDAAEVLAGTDPNDAASVFRISGLTLAGNTASAGFTTVNGKFYHGYTSPDLASWTRDDSSPTVAGDGNPAVWLFTPVPAAGTPARFFRVAVGAAAGSFPATLP